MIRAPFKVVLDANVLYPFTLRDTLLRAAASEFFQVYWSQEILDEATRNLIANNVMTEKKAKGLRDAMDATFPEAKITGYESLIASMKNHEKDRHVVAAAVVAGAQVIVTENIKDFHQLPKGIEAQTADEFLCNLFDLDSDAMIALIKTQASDLRKPPATFDGVLDRLAPVAPNFVMMVRQFVAAPS